MEPVDGAVRLEGDAPLLADALVRSRALLAALRSWRWRARLRACAGEAEQLARTDEFVARALHRALRRARHEGWPASPLLDSLIELRELRAALEALVAQRLGAASRLRLGARSLVEPAPVAASPREGTAPRRQAAASPGSLGEQLSVLLASVAAAPREVSASRRRSALLVSVVTTPREASASARRLDLAAHAALCVEPGLISALLCFGDALEAVGCRPVLAGARLPFTRAELAALLACRAEGDAALERAWHAVHDLDVTGIAARTLAHDARYAPGPGQGALPGPSALVRATFWRRAADAVLEGALAERFAPLHVTEEERAPAVRYLLSRQDDGAARLAPASPRAALLMLAHELTFAAPDRPALVGGRAQLRTWAAEADQLEGDEDWRRLRDATGAQSTRALSWLRTRWSLPARLLDLFGGVEAWP